MNHNGRKKEKNQNQAEETVYLNEGEIEAEARLESFLSVTEKTFTQAFIEGAIWALEKLESQGSLDLPPYYREIKRQAEKAARTFTAKAVDFAIQALETVPSGGN